jgi:hypothetical protein
MMPEAGERTCLLAVHGLRRGRLLQRAAEIQRHNGRDGAEQERHPPSPFLQLVERQGLLQNHDNEECEKLPADERDILE